MAGYCADCAHLNKDKASVSEYGHKLYGCDAHGNVCGWVRTDSELKQQGCSDWTEEHRQVSFFD